MFTFDNFINKIKQPENNMAIGHFYQQIVKNAPILNNQFYCTILGEVPTTQQTIALKDLHFYSKTAKLPKFDVKTESLSFHGQTFSIPTICAFDHSYDLTIICDKELRMWHFWKAWLDEISAFKQSGGVSKSGILKGVRKVTNTQIKLDLLKDSMYVTSAYGAPSDSDIITTYTMEGVYPTGVGEISFGHDSATICTFSVAIQYQYFFEGPSDPLR